MADHSVVPERDFQAALDLIVEYGLDVHDKNIKPFLEEAGLPGPHQRFAWDCLTAKLAPYREYHATYPFRVPLADNLGTSRSSFLRVAATDQPVPWRDEHATRHTNILGPTGGGKSTLLRHVTNASLTAGKIVKAWDLKSDLRDVAITHDFFIVGPTTVFLPLARVPYLTVSEQASITIDCVKGAFFVAETANQVLYPALLRLWEKSPNPSVADLYDLVLASAKPTDTFNQKDAIRRIAARLQRFMTAYPSAGTATTGPSVAALNDRHVHVDGSIHHDATAFLILLFSAHLYTARRATGRRNWTHVIVGDEANLFAGESGQTVQGTSLYHHHYQLFREFGINVTLASSNRLDPSITTNAGTIVVLTSPADTDYYAALLRLTPKQREYLARMPRGECLVRLVGYPDVIHARFDPINAEKHVPMDAWSAALERHNPPQTRPPTLQGTPETTEALPPNTPSPEPSTTHRPVIALNKHEEALLHVVCDGITPSTPAYKKAGLGLADGDNAARRLAQKGLVHRERIVIHSGRGGHGIGLAASNSGYARAGKERSVRTRGGDSVQHQYFVQELHHALPGSTIEGMIGTKPVDLLLPLNTQRDTKLLEYLRSLLPTGIALNTGCLLALEVEVSDPAKTAPNNVTKNAQNGIALTLVLVLPKHIKPTREHLATVIPADHRSSLLVLSALDLMAALNPRG